MYLYIDKALWRKIRLRVSEVRVADHAVYAWRLGASFHNKTEA